LNDFVAAYLNRGTDEGIDPSSTEADNEMDGRDATLKRSFERHGSRLAARTERNEGNGPTPCTNKEKYMNWLSPLALAALCLTAPASAQITAFQHIVLVIQENRTPDNLFQGLCTTPSACSTQPSSQQYDIQTAAWLDKTSPKGWTDPHATPFGIGYDISHLHLAFVTMCDRNASGACAMDGAADEACRPPPCPVKAAFGYVDNSTGALQPYLDIVHDYGWGNYMFQTNQGPSFSAHQYLFGATSAPSAADDHSGIFAGGAGTPTADVLPGQDRQWL
jgi:phospholipase C